MLNSLFSSATSNIEITSILICTLVSIILGICVAITHKLTSKYTKNFLITLATLPVLVQTIIIMVNGNLGTSIATVGAFSLVRFRSMPGTSKEMISVFFAMAIGLMTGMGYVILAAIVTIIVSIITILLYRIKLFDTNKQEKILRITIPENLDYTNMFDDIFKKYTKEVDLEQVKTTDMGSLFDLCYRVILNSNINEKEFIDEIRVKNGNLKVMLSHEINQMEM